MSKKDLNKNLQFTMKNTMTSKRCTIVMYHYVRNMHETEYPDIKGLLIDKFKGQLTYLSNNYSIIKLEDYIEFLNGEKEIPDNPAVLSFDDGFKDHYINVFPILKEMKLPACFFPITGPLSDGVVPAVHKTHFLLAKIGTKTFANELNKNLKNEFPDLIQEFLVDDKIKNNITYRFDDPLTTNLKYNISTLPSKSKVEIMNRIFTKFFENEKEFCKDLYMIWDEMNEMIEEGMSFGSHSKTHPRLAKRSEKEQFTELKESKDVLEKNLNQKISLFSYPHGNFNDTTIKLLKKLGFNCALTERPELNEGKVDVFKINRLDTNHLPFR